MGDIFKFSVAGDRGSLTEFYCSNVGVALIEVMCLVSISNFEGTTALAAKSS